MFSLEIMRDLKKEGITTEEFLDYLCQKHGLLLHGSIHRIGRNKILAKNNKIFAANRSAIAIMRSLYSNSGVNLQYPYFISDKNPLVLEVHAREDGKFIKKDTGFVYIIDSDGFKNDPSGSWQFVKEGEGVDIVAVVETENDDCAYPVKIFKDFNS